MFITIMIIGVLICVSHDRAFVERTCTDGVLAFMGDGQVVPMIEGYGQYLDSLDEAEGQARAVSEIARKEKAGAAAAMAVAANGQAASGQAGGKRPAPKAAKLSFKNAREWETVEADVNSLKAELAAAEAAVSAASAGCDYVLVAELSVAVDALAARVEGKEERWLELMELVAEVETAAGG
ncbi:hypothetical protein T492DRAFT_425511 [Pavlovales sp. CCMP2436]|nr:hypothetical protein T492DRAFT_425511 [Pavlovales sp. CCMP2436]